MNRYNEKHIYHANINVNFMAENVIQSKKLIKIYFTGDDGYQNFSVFAQILRSLILNSDKKLLTCFRTENHL